MDFIYAKFDNNLVDINRIDKVLLLKCEKRGEPLSSLNVGDYYLKITVLDSNKITYCDLSELSSKNTSLLEKINSEITRATNAELNLKNMIEEKENELILKIDDEILNREIAIESINNKLPIIVKLNIDFIDLDDEIPESDDNYLLIKNAIKEQAKNNNSLIFIEKSGCAYILSYVQSKPLTSSDEYYNYYFSSIDDDTVYYLNIVFNDISYKPLLVEYTYKSFAEIDTVNKLEKDLSQEITRAKEQEKLLSDKKQDKLTAGDNIKIKNNIISADVDVKKEYVDEQINELLDTLIDTTGILEESLTTKIDDERSRAIGVENNLDSKITNIEEIISADNPNTLAGLLFEEI